MRKAVGSRGSPQAIARTELGEPWSSPAPERQRRLGGYPLKKETLLPHKHLATLMDDGVTIDDYEKKLYKNTFLFP